MVRGGALPCASMTTRRSARFYRLIGWIGTSRPITRLHPRVYRLTGGRWFVGRNLGVLNVIVVTTGRRTGRRREIPLYAFQDGRNLVVVGSNAGSDREPAWVGNLRANPAARVLVGRDERPVLAREAEGAERARLWALATGSYPGYDDYARWTDRHIPVIALEPAPDGES
jgi:deazaflavin-dependent oxidoreductase (nitroreductase family)